ncbi:proteolipid protein 2-like [Mobula birostris]|uniref:proteolipid protein 2-like n=1 Tax=Mobula birostris TaxID=1983395 RepID=UPI003B285B66
MAGEETQGTVDQDGGIFGRFKAYARTRKGTILLAEMVISLIIFICFCASISVGYTTAPLIEFFFSLAIFIIFMNGYDKSLNFIHWPCTDCIRCGIAVIIYIIIGIIGLINGYGATITAGVLSLLAAAIFAYDGYLTFQVLNLKRHTPAPTEPSDNSP